MIGRPDVCVLRVGRAPRRGRVADGPQKSIRGEFAAACVRRCPSSGFLVGKELLVDAAEGPLSGGGFGGEPSIAYCSTS